MNLLTKKFTTKYLRMFVVLALCLAQLGSASLAFAEDKPATNNQDQTISVSIPVTEAVWTGDKTMNIHWTAGSALTNSLRYIQGVNVATGGTFNIEYELKTLSASGDFAWSVPSWIPVGKYKIRVGVQPMGYGSYGESSEFYINTTNVAPPVASTTVSTVTVNMPKTLLPWQLGQVMPITWSATGNATSSLRYILAVNVNTGGFYAIENEVKIMGDSGSFSWFIPNNVPQGRYKIRVGVQPNGYGVYGDSAEMYIVASNVATTTPPTAQMNVTIANIGQSDKQWQIGDKIDYKFSISNLPQNAVTYSINAEKVDGSGVVVVRNNLPASNGTFSGDWRPQIAGDYYFKILLYKNNSELYGKASAEIASAVTNNFSVASVVAVVPPTVVPPTVTTGKTVDSPYLFALKGQKDDEGDVNYDIYASFNRVIAGGRVGKGVEKVNVILYKDKAFVDQCSVNLLKNTNTCAGSKSVSINDQGVSQQAVAKINLDPKYYDSASFEIQYSSLFKPNGWTVDIGDSPSNDGWSGDGGDTSNDAEVNVVNGDILVYGNDNSPAGKRSLYEANKAITAGSIIVLNVSDGHFDWAITSAGTVVKDIADVKVEPIKVIEKVQDKANVIETTDAMPIMVSPVVSTAVSNVGDMSDTLIIKLQRQISSLEQKIVDLEKSLVTKIDDKLTEKLKGRILLQVEDKGQAWYVDPASKNKLYLKDGQSAYDIMRALGLGIKTSDLDKIATGVQKISANLPDADGDGLPDDLEKALGTDPNKSDTDGDGFADTLEVSKNFNAEGSGNMSIDQKLVNRMRGRILLQVEDRGQAWYINPVDGKKYFLGDGNTAYEVMRNLSLGINNDQLRKIQVGEFEEQTQ